MKYYTITMIDSDTNTVKTKYTIERDRYSEAVKHVHLMKDYVKENIHFEIS